MLPSVFLLLEEIAVKVTKKLFVDYVTQSLSDPLKRRKANSAQDRIVNKLLSTMEPFFQIEMSEDTAELMARELQAIVQNVGITGEVLAANNYNTDKILSYCLAASPPSQELKKLGLSPFFEDLLRQVIISIIQVAPILPDWEQANWKENFRNLERIFDKLDQQSSLLKEIHSSSEKQSDTFERSYRKYLIREFSQIRIQGLGSVGNVDPLSIETAFVPPRMAPLKADDFRGSVSPPNLDEARKAITIPLKASESGRSIGELLSESSRVVVVGEPGAGKTTLLQHVALSVACKQTSKLHTSLPDSLIPFVIRIRTIEDFDNLPGPKTFMKYCAETLDNAYAEDFVTQVFLEGRALIMIDGLDECQVPPIDLIYQQRTEAAFTEWDRIIKWLERLVDTYDRNYFVITARPAGYALGVLQKYSFAEYRMLQLSEAEQAQYVHNWLLAVESSKSDQDPALIAKRTGEQASDLLARLKRSLYIRLFAKTPLMLSVLCIVHHYKGKRLPERRVELLRECVDVLLYEWRKSKGLRESVIGDLDATRLRALLQPLAWEMCSIGKAQVDLAFVEAIFRKHLPDIQQPPERALEIIKTIRDRTGVLVEASPNFYAFTHLIIQDYLAAEESNRYGVDVLLENAEDPNWEEMIPLAVGANQGGKETLLRGLLQKGMPIMAGRALAACDRVNHTLRAEILDSIGVYLSNPPNLRDNSANQRYAENAWIALMEIGGREIVKPLLMMQQYKYLIPYEESLQLYSKVEYGDIPTPIPQLAMRTAQRCLGSDTLEISNTFGPPAIRSLYMKEKEEPHQGGAWLAGSLSFIPEKYKGEPNEKTPIYDLAVGLDASNAIGDIIWTSLFSIVAIEGHKLEEKLLAITFGVYICSEGQSKEVFTALEQIPYSICPCLQIGLINLLARKFNSLLSADLYDAMRLRWNQVVDEVERHYTRFINLCPSGSWKTGDEGADSADDLTQEFSQTFRTELAKGSSLNWLNNSL